MSTPEITNRRCTVLPDDTAKPAGYRVAGTDGGGGARGTLEVKADDRGRGHDQTVGFWVFPGVYAGLPRSREARAQPISAALRAESHQR
jgi:hypothetical protein